MWGLGRLTLLSPSRRRTHWASAQRSKEASRVLAFLLVRPAGRTHLEVQVLYTPDTGKC